MMWYSYLRKFLFCMGPESAHRLTLSLLRYAPRFCLPTVPGIETTCMGLTFANPVMMAAGFDKNGEYVDALLRLGFGGVEVGTVTPQPQPGNPKPRCFRVPESQALINRMGFNNKGVDHLVSCLSQRKQAGVVGVNIGKNKTTPNDKAVDDYVYCLERVASVADYVTINVSSPNTPGLRELQSVAVLNDLLQTLDQKRQGLQQQHQKRLPLALKICVDLEPADVRDIVDCALQHHIDAIIVSNTTIDHVSVAQYQHGGEQGGLSGAPLTTRACQYLAMIQQHAAGRLDVIGVGGIMSTQDASQRIDAGASLVQLYTGLVYRGPSLLVEIVRDLRV